MAGADGRNTRKAPAQTGAFFDVETPAQEPLLHLVLRPHRSLPRAGFALLMLVAWGFFLVPLSMLLGTPALWGLLPFTLGALLLLWYFVNRNYADAQLTEELTLWPELIRVDRFNPRGPSQHWQANPYWVRLRLFPEGGPVENYLTLRGGGREIELGAFLSPEERAEIHRDLDRWLGKLGGLSS